MNAEATDDLSDSEKLSLIIAELATIKVQLAKLTATDQQRPFIVPTAVYTRKEVENLTGYSQSKVIRAEKDRLLKRSKGMGSPRYLGANVMEWVGWPGKGITVNVIGQDSPQTQTANKRAEELERQVQRLKELIKQLP